MTRSLTKQVLTLITAILLITSLGSSQAFAAEQGIKAINDGKGITKQEETISAEANVDEVKHRSFDYTGEAVPNSDPILYIGTYDMYTDSGTASFTLSTSLEDKIRVVGPFSPSTLNHYYLCERESYRDACEQKLQPNNWCLMDISVNNLPVAPEIAEKAIYIKEFGDCYVAAVLVDKLSPMHEAENAIIKTKVKEIIDSIKITPNE